MTRASARIALAAGLLLVSTAAPFIVLSRIHPFALVLLRMGLAAPLFLAWAAATAGARLPREHRGRVALGGALLAAHFLLWIGAFELTSYASNLLLLIAQPVMAALLGARVGERPTRETWISLALSVAGLALIVRGDVELGGRALLGDLCSVLGGAAIAVFYAATRRARREMPVTAFMGWTLAAGALASLPVVLLSGVPLGPRAPGPGQPTGVLGWDPAPWVWLAGLVLVTTMGGHGLMNAASRAVRLFTVNVVIVLEPAIAILLGVLLLGQQTPSWTQVAGGAVLAGAVVVALLPELRADGPAPPPGMVPE